MKHAIRHMAHFVVQYEHADDRLRARRARA